MKVGTDGVLLGAWTTIPSDSSAHDLSILDIGTGSGLIALMLAQKAAASQAQSVRIDAIDIDPSAVEQADMNFAASPWSQHLSAHSATLQQWAPDISYHLIVSNPPYFVDSLKNPNAQRSAARHTDSLSYAELIKHSARLLAPEGTLCLILPIEAEQTIRSLAAEHGLYSTRICRIKGVERKPYKRLLIAFRRSEEPEAEKNIAPAEESLVLMDTSGARSQAYATLCQDYYL